jgi:hypothetical protein
METTHQLAWYKKVTVLLAFTTIIPCTLLLTSQVTPDNNNPTGQSQTITPDVASRYVSNYADRAEKVKAVVKGVVIEAGQLEALNNVASAHPSSSKFRLYFGTDDNGADVSIAVAMDPEGNDQTDTMYSSARTGSNLCPPVCDANGTIGGN